MPAKSILITSIRVFAFASQKSAFQESVLVLEAAEQYENSEGLGGPPCARLCRQLGNLRVALGGAALPSNMEGMLWSFLVRVA